jgi:hypothetical protein
MQKWEYCAIVGIRWGQNKKNLWAYYPNLWQFTTEGHKETKIADPELGKTIAQLGEQGWELTGVGLLKEEQNILYFKRPLD